MYATEHAAVSPFTELLAGLRCWCCESFVFSMFAKVEGNARAVSLRDPTPLIAIYGDHDGLLEAVDILHERGVFAIC
jgi:hypothetical protein